MKSNAMAPFGRHQPDVNHKIDVGAWCKSLPIAAFLPAQMSDKHCRIANASDSFMVRVFVTMKCPQFASAFRQPNVPLPAKFGCKE